MGSNYDNYKMGAEAPAEIFSGGEGKRRFHYLLSQTKLYSCNQGFAKGLKPKVKMILFKTCCNWAAC